MKTYKEKYIFGSEEFYGNYSQSWSLLFEALDEIIGLLKEIKPEEISTELAWRSSKVGKP